jgi:hypothetical protein
MNLIDFIWIFSFFLIFLSLHVTNHLIVSSISAKPLGKQSLFDLSIKDTFFTTKIYGSLACLVCIFARFDSFRLLLSKNLILTTVLCSIYSFSFTCMCVNAGCLCIVRILCIVKINYIEEKIGEFKIRLISSTFTLIAGVTVTCLFVICGEVNTGTPVALLTLHVIPSGKKMTQFFHIHHIHISTHVFNKNTIGDILVVSLLVSL